MKQTTSGQRDRGRGQAAGKQERGWASRKPALRLGPHKMLTGSAFSRPGAHRGSPGWTPGPLFPHFVKGVAIAKDTAQLRRLPAVRQALGFGGPLPCPEQQALSQRDLETTPSRSQGGVSLFRHRTAARRRLCCLSERLLSRPPADRTPAGTAAHRAAPSLRAEHAPGLGTRDLWWPRVPIGGLPAGTLRRPSPRVGSQAALSGSRSKLGARVLS